MKPSHHPIIENKMKCSDCHNPHGALTPGDAAATRRVNAQCTSCHADKRGPFVFSHPPVDENCLTCHNPHGSVHYKLLNEHVPEPVPGLPRLVEAPGLVLPGPGRMDLPVGVTRVRPARASRAPELGRQHAPDRARVRQLPQRRSTARTRRAAAASSSRDDGREAIMKRKPLSALIAGLFVAGAVVRAGRADAHALDHARRGDASAASHQHQSGKDPSKLQRVPGPQQRRAVERPASAAATDTDVVRRYGENFGRDDQYISLRGGQLRRVQVRRLHELAAAQLRVRDAPHAVQRQWNGTLLDATFPSPDPVHLEPVQPRLRAQGHRRLLRVAADEPVVLPRRRQPGHVRRHARSAPAALAPAPATASRTSRSRSRTRRTRRRPRAATARARCSSR